MRVHVILDDDLVRQLDELTGPRGRSPFIAEAVRQAVDRERRWRALKRSAGAIADHGHEWDEDPAAWVHAQRRADPRRVG
jgi:metal-responsive CopG/Arc/MetJ family transcriptional regulator